MSTEYRPYLWHDNLIRALRIDVGGEGAWKSDLLLDIDHVVRTDRALQGTVQFWVSPATLAFHDACDLRVAIDCGDTGGQVALHELSIDRVVRDLIEQQKVCFNRPYYRWRIELNWPKGGVISFTASRFSQLLRAEAVPTDNGRLPEQALARDCF
jgi:hypothetical protein